MAIPVGVGESNDSRAGLALVIDAHRIVRHFSHPHPPIRSPCDIDRVHDERLGRHEFDARDIAGIAGVMLGICIVLKRHAGNEFRAHSLYCSDECAVIISESQNPSSHCPYPNPAI